MTGWPAAHLVLRAQHEFHCQQTTYVDNGKLRKLQSDAKHFQEGVSFCNLRQKSENNTEYHVEVTGPMLPGLANPHRAYVAMTWDLAVISPALMSSPSSL